MDRMGCILPLAADGCDRCASVGSAYNGHVVSNRKGQQMSKPIQEEQLYVKLTDCLPSRPLGIALAHCMMTAKPGTERMDLLNRIYGGCSWQQNAVTRCELARCRAAVRGQTEAVVL